MRTALVLFTCDLRVHDHPALAAAARDAEEVAAVFVLDDTILGGDFARPNRLSYLCDALADLDRSLRRLGTPLIVRRGDVVDQTMAVADEAHAGAIYLTEGVSAYARRRAQRLSQAAASARSEVRPFEGITVVPPGHLSPGGGDHVKVFTPYYRQWAGADLRAVEAAPSRLSPVSEIDSGKIPRLSELTDGPPSPDLRRGGRDGGSPPGDGVVAGRGSRLCECPRRPGRRRHVAPQPRPPLRLPLTPRARLPVPGGTGRRRLRAPTVLA